MAPWVYTLIAVTVTGIWAVANVAAILSSEPVPQELHYIMGLVAGGAFGGQAIASQRKRQRRRKDEEE